MLKTIKETAGMLAIAAAVAVIVLGLACGQYQIWSACLDGNVAACMFLK